MNVYKSHQKLDDPLKLATRNGKFNKRLRAVLHEQQKS